MNEDDYAAQIAKFWQWYNSDLCYYRKEINMNIELKPRKQDGNVIWLFERED